MWGTASRRSQLVNTSSTSAASTSSGMSAKVTPVARSTACTHTTRLRIRGTCAAGTVRPWAVCTGADHAAADSPRPDLSQLLASQLEEALIHTGNEGDVQAVEPRHRGVGDDAVAVEVPARSEQEIAMAHRHRVIVDVHKPSPSSTNRKAD